ncbi:MAG: alpha/beta hydrolase, partial [Gaiellaceae bacterium]
MSDHVLSTPSRAARAGWRHRLARAAAFARTEHGILVLALGIVGLHVADDNYLRPEPGTSSLDHLASGLVPLALLAAVAALYPRLRAGARAATAMTIGAIGASIGFPSLYYALDGSASGDHYTGLLAAAAGVVLVLTGPVTLWKSRRAYAGRRRRYLRRAGSTATALVAAPVLLLFVVIPFGFAYGYTHLGRTGDAPVLGIPAEPVTITTSDSLELTASYVRSKNRAAVVVFPGASAVKEARLLAKHGYGVLLLDPRGQGGSEGDLVRWAGDRDLIAAAEYLQQRPDVDPARIGGFGSSVGGEILLGAAAKSTAYKAVVSEGAGLPAGEGADVVTGIGHLLRPAFLGISAWTTVFSNHGPPPPIVDDIAKIAPRPVFLIYADPGQGGEVQRQPKYFAAAGQPKSMWKVPGASHTGG